MCPCCNDSQAVNRIYGMCPLLESDSSKAVNRIYGMCLLLESDSSQMIIRMYGMCPLLESDGSPTIIMMYGMCPLLESDVSYLINNFNMSMLTLGYSLTFINKCHLVMTLKLYVCSDEVQGK